MKLVYIDESQATQQSQWLLLAAFVMDSEEWAGLEDTLGSAVGGFNWNIVLDKNLKNLRRPPEGAFEQGEPKELSHQVYENLECDIDYTVISTLINVDNYEPSVWGELKEDPYLQAYIFLLERVEMYLYNLEDKAMVFIDSRDSRQDRAVKQAHRELQEEGSEHVNFQNVHNISIPLEDEVSYGLQLADWMVKAIKDAVVDGYTTEFFQHVRPHLHRSDDGDIVGYGMKIYPETFDELHEIGPND